MRSLATAGALLTGAALLAGCAASSSDPSGSSSLSPSAAATAISDGMVDIGSGRQIRVTCAGSGNAGPTVVLISGAQMAGDDWQVVRKAGATSTTFDALEQSDASVFAQASAFAPVCTYDRPGTLRMDQTVSPTTKVTQPTTAQQDVADLDAWLTAAGLAPPYVLVGHSWGGMIATLYAATYPSKSAGLVLVDPASVFLQDHLTGAQWEEFVALPDGLLDGSLREAPDYRNSVDAVRVAKVGAIPAVVLSSDQPFNFGIGDDAWPAWLAAGDSVAQYLKATHVTQTDSGHMIPNENPDAVTSAIRDVVTAAR